MQQARLYLPLFAAAMAGLIGVTPATAQQTTSMICGTRDNVVAQLQGRYGESVRSVGLAPQNRIVEVYASDETGSWTITVTSADGTTCLMASGQYFEDMPQQLAGDPL